ncbi:MAG: phosphatidylserine decarboxylase [Bacteroidales bacterium]|nr:phosphatidylserine decarboxylase [Bacteroidales bacterium]
MKIDRNSRGTLALVYALSLVAGCFLLLFVHVPWVVWPLIALLVWFCVWQTAFFRVPSRVRSGGPSAVTSVADGRVVILEKVYEGEFLHRDCIQLSVYMNFFDVHANFWPADGVITYYHYYPGEHFLAFAPKASAENEHSCVGMRLSGGQEILFKQLAGVFARRIVCYAQEGISVKGGAQCGIIKFGSRIDLFLPLEARLKVKLGDTVRACETVLAEF